DEIRAFLHHLATHEGRIVVNDLDAARWLGRRFIAIDDAIWCSVQEVGWYAAMAQALKAAFDAGVLSKEDLWGADRPLMTRLRASKTAEVQHWLALLRLDVDFARVEAGGDLEALPKVRAVDPPVLLNGHLATLANLDPEFREYRETYIANKQGHWQLQPRPMHSPPASQHIS
ncbi:MAG: hypothetical protein JXB35_06415, partial [Anaerolineae bacterium]|nr:hypothetical protein [Anaerolineae bacterium]